MSRGKNYTIETSTGSEGGGGVAIEIGVGKGARNGGRVGGDSI